MRWKILAILTGSILFVLGGLAQADGSKPSPAQHLLLHLVKDGDSFRVLQTTLVPSSLPKQRDPNHIFPWRFELVEPGELVGFRSGLDDPTILRGEFANPDDPGKIDAVFIRRTGPVHFMIRLPAGSAGRLEFFELKPDLVREATLPRDAYQKLGSVELGGRE